MLSYWITKTFNSLTKTEPSDQVFKMQAFKILSTLSGVVHLQKCFLLFFNKFQAKKLVAVLKPPFKRV